MAFTICPPQDREMETTKFVEASICSSTDANYFRLLLYGNLKLNLLIYFLYVKADRTAYQLRVIPSYQKLSDREATQMETSQFGLTIALATIMSEFSKNNISEQRCRLHDSGHSMLLYPVTEALDLTFRGPPLLRS